MVTKKMYFMRTEETGPVLAHDILNIILIICLFNFFYLPLHLSK